MKTIKVGDKVCANCGRFLQYYQKNVHNFSPCGYGFCSLKNRYAQEAEACPKFCKRNQPDLVAEVNNALLGIKQIEKLLNDLNYKDTIQ